MTNALAVVAGFVHVLAVAIFLQAREALAFERARVNELLRLLEAKAAPAEVAAFLDPPAPQPEGEWITSPDGLIVIGVEDD